MSPAPVPQVVGADPRVKATVPPLVKIEPGIQVLVWLVPLTLNDWM